MGAVESSSLVRPGVVDRYKTFLQGLPPLTALVNTLAASIIPFTLAYSFSLVHGLPLRGWEVLTLCGLIGLQVSYLQGLSSEEPSIARRVLPLVVYPFCLSIWEVHELNPDSAFCKDLLVLSLALFFCCLVNQARDGIRNDRPAENEEEEVARPLLIHSKERKSVFASAQATELLVGMGFLFTAQVAPIPVTGSWILRAMGFAMVGDAVSTLTSWGWHSLRERRVDNGAGVFIDEVISVSARPLGALVLALPFPSPWLDLASACEGMKGYLIRKRFQYVSHPEQVSLSLFRVICVTSALAHAFFMIVIPIYKIREAVRSGGSENALLAFTTCWFFYVTLITGWLVKSKWGENVKNPVHNTLYHALVANSGWQAFMVGLTNSHLAKYTSSEACRQISGVVTAMALALDLVSIDPGREGQLSPQATVFGMFLAVKVYQIFEAD